MTTAHRAGNHGKTRAVSKRMMRPEITTGSRLYGVTRYEYTRMINGRLTLFHILCDGLRRTATLRVYPSGGWTDPTHEITVHGVTPDIVGRQVYREEWAPAPLAA